MDAEPEHPFIPSESTLTNNLTHHTNITTALLQTTQRSIDPTANVSSKHTELISTFVESTRNFGVDLFVRKLQEETIHESCSWLDIGANKESLDEVSGVLSSKIKEKGIASFVSEMTIDILKRYCADMGIDNENATKEDVEEQITGEVMLLGLEQLLGRLTVNVLKEYYEGLNIGTGKVPVGMKKEGIIEQIVLKFYSEAPVVNLKTVKQEVPSTPRRVLTSTEITSKTPKKDLEQMYVKDLKEYLQQRKLKHDDKKSVLVSRVLRHLKSPDAEGIEQPPTPLIEPENHNNTNNHDGNNNSTTTTTTTTTTDNHTNGENVTLRKTKRRKHNDDPNYIDVEGESGDEETTDTNNKKKKMRVEK